MLYVAEVSRSQLCITMSSSLSLIQDFIEDVSEYVQNHEIHVDNFSFKFAITEAVTNTIEHGNKKNSRLLTKFRLWFDSESLNMMFEDEGKGFPWEKYKAVACPESTAESGRGLFIIKQCGYELDFNQAGNQLFLTRPLNEYATSAMEAL